MKTNTDKEIVTHKLKTTWSIFSMKKTKSKKSSNFTYVVVRPSRIFSSHIYCITILQFELLPEHWCWLVHSTSIMESSKKVIVSPTLYPPLLLFCESNSLVYEREEQKLCAEEAHMIKRGCLLGFPRHSCL